MAATWNEKVIISYLKIGKSGASRYPPAPQKSFLQSFLSPVSYYTMQLESFVSNIALSCCHLPQEHCNNNNNII